MSSLPRLFPDLVPDPQAQLPMFQSDTPDMIRLLDQVHRIAPQKTSVLLSGETGTGKSRLARLIHELSPRRDQPFLVVNCGALAAGLIESELFGHVRGAFTGAVGARAGRLAVSVVSAGAADFATPALTVHRPQTLAEIEAVCIAEALRRNRHNRVDTALELGISRLTLYRKIHKYGSCGVNDVMNR